jgi:hypothetical protein
VGISVSMEIVIVRNRAGKLGRMRNIKSVEILSYGQEKEVLVFCAQ